MKPDTLLLSNPESANLDALKIAPKHFKKTPSTETTVQNLPTTPPASQTFDRAERPWGHYETLSLGNRFQVKSIVVMPGEQLSLQSHHHRSEHWVVVEGTAAVQVGDKEQTLTENQSIYIPLGQVHRLSNPGKFPMQLIEVQTGAYLGEDDIVRYEDIYNRA